MKEKLEKIIGGTKQFVKSKTGVGILAVGLALGYTGGTMGCGGEDDTIDDGYSSSQSSSSDYLCGCEGNGLRVTMDVNNASSKSKAESWATDKCREDYPGKGCSCDCVKKGGSSGDDDKPYERNTDW